MSKAIVSYYDWELSFKSKSQPKLNKTKEEINSLGISGIKFKNFLKKWKENNME